MCGIGGDMHWKCIVLGINHQSGMLILPWPCAECGGNGVCGAKDNTAAFVPEENNTADDAALCRRRCRRCRPRSHVSLCQVTRPDKVAYCKRYRRSDVLIRLYAFIVYALLRRFVILQLLHCDLLWIYTLDAKTEQNCSTCFLLKLDVIKVESTQRADTSAKAA